MQKVCIEMIKGYCMCVAFFFFLKFCVLASSGLSDDALVLEFLYISNESEMLHDLTSFNCMDEME